MEIYNIVIDGLVVPKYCVEHNIPFNDVLKRFRRMRPNKKLVDYSDEALVRYIFKEFYKNSYDRTDDSKYLIGKETVSKVARRNNIIPSNLKGAIHRGLKKDPSASVEEIVDAYIKRNESKHIYTCDKRPLTRVCEDLGLNTETVRIIFRDTYPKEVIENMTQDEMDYAITEITYNLATRLANSSRRR